MPNSASNAVSVDERTRLFALAHSALARIAESGLLPDPATYEVWFAYLSGADYALVRDVDALIESGDVTPAAMRTIHDRHLSTQQTVQRLLTVGESLCEEARKVGTAVGAANASVDQFGRGLDTATDRLGAIDGHVALDTIVADLIKSTDRIKRTNTRLQAQLRQSEVQVRQLQHSVEFLQVESTTDPVTAVGNRKLFDHTLVRMVEQSQATGAGLALALADVDRFKDFNDLYGHQIGDDVLRLVASVIKGTVRADDLICRYGGDEFAILLPRTGRDEALAISETVRRAVSEKGLLRRSTQQALGRISVSIGVAEHRRGDAADALLNAADACLLDAKRKGRNCVIG